MAKAMYIGVDNKARKVKKAYIGVDGKARKVKKIYVGVNGVARLCWSGSTPAGQAVITSSGTFTVPDGVKTVDIFCVGGGGGGGGAYFYAYDSSSSSNNLTTWGSAGGAGYTSTTKNVAVTPGEALTITIGGGGGGGKGYMYQNSYGSVYTDGESSASYMTNGGAGGQTSVKRSSTVLAKAEGGYAGIKVGSSLSYSNGANGGSGSSCGGSHQYTWNGSTNTNRSYYAYTTDGVTDSSVDGNGGARCFYDYSTDSSYSSGYPNSPYGTAGKGQGTTTRAFGESSGTLYSAGYNAIAVNNKGEVLYSGATGANSGNSGGDQYGWVASANAGNSGVVIIRWAEQDA